MGNNFEKGFDGFGGLTPVQDEKKTMKLSRQAMTALMMALQKSLVEQSDIVPVLEGWQLADSDDGLIVLNPPLVRLPDDMEGDA